MIIEMEFAYKHFSLVTRHALDLIGKYIELNLDQVGIGGDFAGNRLIISPESYKKFIVPEICTLSRYIHNADKWAVNTSDCNLWEVIRDFLIECEVDGYLDCIGICI